MDQGGGHLVAIADELGQLVASDGGGLAAAFEIVVAARGQKPGNVLLASSAD